MKLNIDEMRRSEKRRKALDESARLFKGLPEEQQLALFEALVQWSLAPSDRIAAFGPPPHMAPIVASLAIFGLTMLLDHKAKE